MAIRDISGSYKLPKDDVLNRRLKKIYFISREIHDGYCPSDSGFSPDSKAYRFEIRRVSDESVVYYGPYYQGAAIKQSPRLVDILSSLSTDASFGDYTFEEFCSELRYDTDSLRAKKLWKACKKTQKTFPEHARIRAICDLIGF
jgi:hypothetical protein